MSKIYYQIGRKNGKGASAYSYAKAKYNAEKLVPMRMTDAYWGVLEEEYDESFDCSGFWNYLVREDEVYAY